MRDLYIKSYEDAIDLMDMCDDLEPTSALKECAANNGIPFGDEMEAFILWAR